MTNAGNIRIFDKSVSIITGGVSGIGKALAAELSRRGSEVVLADLQADIAEEVVSQINSSGGKASFIKLDVRDFESVQAAVKNIFHQKGRLDFMFNNAGIGIGGEVKSYRIEDWDDVTDVNYRGVTNGVQAAYPVMLDQRFGHIINTASMAGLTPMPFSTSYCAAKHAVVGLSKSLRAEAASEGIRVSVLCPGVIRTPILYGGKYGRLLFEIPRNRLPDLWKKLAPMPPDNFAPKVINAVAKNRAIIIYPSWWKLIWYLNRISPVLGIKLSALSFRHMKKDLEKIRQEEVMKQINGNTHNEEGIS